MPIIRPRVARDTYFGYPPAMEQLHRFFFDEGSKGVPQRTQPYGGSAGLAELLHRQRLTQRGAGNRGGYRQGRIDRMLARALGRRWGRQRNYRRNQLSEGIIQMLTDEYADARWAGQRAKSREEYIRAKKRGLAALDERARLARKYGGHAKEQTMQDRLQAYDLLYQLYGRGS